MPASDASPAPPLARLRQWVGAWQPLTGPGLAAFASASIGRIVGFQIIVAAGVAIVLSLALRLSWYPVVQKAISELPETASIARGKLSWPEPEPKRLAQNAWLDLVVHPGASRSDIDLGQSADLQLDLRPVGFRLAGALGHIEQAYPPSWNVDLGRLPAMARWSAWRMPVSIAIAAGTMLLLIVIWWALATLYAPFAWVLSRVLGRHPSFPQVWKIAAASLWVGALVGAAGIAAYGSGMIRMPGLAVTQAIHVPVPWLWLAWGVVSLPAKGSGPSRTAKRNPFANS